MAVAAGKNPVNDEWVGNNIVVDMQRERLSLAS